jgi:hypothetical protein
MKRNLLLCILLLAIAGCRSAVVTSSPDTPAAPAPQTPEQAERETNTPEPTAQASPVPSPTDVPQRTSWLVLGGDNRAHRHGTGWGDKTDVMLLVSILETNPIDVVVVQFPRNLYVPWPGHDDVWMFSIYRSLGAQGLRQYVADVFGLVTQGLFYVDMDGFVSIVDDLGTAGYPLVAGGRKLNGLQALAYLRDNDNNWNHGSYDAGQRVFGVFEGLVIGATSYLSDDPIIAVDQAVSEWGGIVETDQNVLQMYFLARVGVKLLREDYQVRWVQLEEPWLMRGPTPIVQNEKPMRGMIANVPSGQESSSAPRQVLSQWMLECVLEQTCEADPD